MASRSTPSCVTGPKTTRRSCCRTLAFSRQVTRRRSEIANLTTTESNNILAATSGQAAFVPPSGGLGSQRMALVTVTGTAAAAGTEVLGGSYARQLVTYAAPAGGSISSNVALQYTNMPGPITVTGVEEYDANNTTRRWFGNLSTPKPVNQGDTFTIAPGSLTKSLS